MEEDNQTVELALEEALNYYTHDHADSQRLQAIIRTNFKFGRVMNFLSLSDNHKLTDYVQRVIGSYERNHQYVECVQNGEEAVWSGC